MNKVAVLLLLLSACATTPKESMSELIPALVETTQTETFLLGSDMEVIRTSQGVEAHIVYESPVENDVLAAPALRFTFEGLPDQITSGLGWFYVFGRDVHIERI